MALTDTEIKKLKATGKEYQKADSRGLVLVVRAKGEKFWRCELRLDGDKFRYGYGNYPEITLDHARKIHAVARQLVELGKHPATLLDDAGKVDLASFEKIVIGASIHYGRHHPTIHAFIKRNQAILDSKPNAFFSVNVVARKPKKRQADTNPYLKKFLKSISWQPKQLAVFAGKIDYPSYNFVDRTVIRMIMWLTKGPTDPNAIVEFTDWDQVRSFAKTITEM